MNSLPNPVDYAVPAFVLLIVLEMLWARFRAPEKYEPKDTLTSLLFGFGSSVAGALTGAAIFGLSVYLYQYRAVTIPFAWWAWIACFVLDDFAYYVFHRAAHRVRWFWASHVNHHSSQHYNLSTALRQTWTGFIAGSFLFRLPLMLIGFHPAMVAFVGGINLIYQFWIHTETIGRLPRWFEAVMNTPSHHRVHHATNPRYLDANYAGTLIIWDKLFGSFVPELDHDKPVFGLVENIKTYNPFVAVLGEYWSIAKDAAGPKRSLFDRLRYVFAPPGWCHDGSGKDSHMIKANYLQAHSAETGTPGLPANG